MPSSPGDSSSDRVTIPPSSKATCPSSSIFESPSNRKSMEEVWKEIKLASLSDCSINTMPFTTNTTHSAFRKSNLHEFLARPFSKDSPSRCLASSICNPTSAAEFTFSGPLEQSQPALLSLSSGSSFQKHNHDFNTSSDALDSSKCPSNTKKRAQEDTSNSSDRRQKRMIKNREAAARSRARKQAYTNELELVLAHLQEENARLRRQPEKFCLTSSSLHPKKGTLHRASTAPF